MAAINLGNVRGATGATGATGAKGDAGATGATGPAGASTFAALTDKTTVDIPAINTPVATALNARELSSNKMTDVDANKTSNIFYPTVKAVFDWVSELFVKGAASSTDNAIARFDGLTGKLLQNSLASVTDQGYGTFTSLGVNGTPPANGGVRFNRNGGNPFFEWQQSGATIGQIRADSTSTAGGSIYVANPAGNSYVTFITTDGTSAAGSTGFKTQNPTATIDVNGTSRFRGGSTFDGQIIDNVGSSGTDGQVLKKVGGLVIWSNP